MKIQKFASRLLSKSAFWIFSWQSLKSKIKKFVSRRALLSKNPIEIYVGHLSVKINIRKFASHEPDKCAILILAGRLSVKIKIQKFAIPLLSKSTI